THAPRRTVTPSVVQGLVSCAKCGYALYRTSTRSSARKIHYYRCLGSDKYRRFAGPVCDNRPVRQDLLDEVVWMEIVRLLEDPQRLKIFRFKAGFGVSGGFPSRRIQQRNLILCGSTDGWERERGAFRNVGRAGRAGADWRGGAEASHGGAAPGRVASGQPRGTRAGRSSRACGL